MDVGLSCLIFWGYTLLKADTWNTGSPEEVWKTQFQVKRIIFNIGQKSCNPKRKGSSSSPILFQGRAIKLQRCSPSWRVFSWFFTSMSWRWDFSNLFSFQLTIMTDHSFLNFRPLYGQLLTERQVRISKYPILEDHGFQQRMGPFVKRTLWKHGEKKPHLKEVRLHDVVMVLRCFGIHTDFLST